jgi:hypothetical protein
MLLLGAALVMVLRAPVYFSEPSFWAEDGQLFFPVAWERPPIEGLTHHPQGYLLLWANLSTTLAAVLVRTGLLSLARAPIVIVLCAFAVQLLPAAVIAFSQAPFWGGFVRRTLAIMAVVVGGLHHETWLNTINSQPWLVVTASLLLLEPAEASGIRAWSGAATIAVAGLSAPVASALVPLFAWRAWRARTRANLLPAVVATLCALVQAACVWSATRSESGLGRTIGLELPVLAGTVWMRTIVQPTLGVHAAERLWGLLQHAGGVDVAWGPLLIGAGLLLGWLARGLPPGARLLLPGAYVLVTTLTVAAALGDKRLLMSSPWPGNRYFYAPSVILLLMLLACVRRGGLRVLVSATLLALGLIHGVARYRWSVGWQPSWPRFADEVQAWEADPLRPLSIWPPPWTMRLRPVERAGGP